MAEIRIKDMNKRMFLYPRSEWSLDPCLESFPYLHLLFIIIYRTRVLYASGKYSLMREVKERGRVCEESTNRMEVMKETPKTHYIHGFSEFL